MKKKLLCLSMFCFLMINSCGRINSGGSGSNTDTNPNTAPNDLYVGHWLSDCVNLGGGSLNRVYKEVGTDYNIKIAILIYASANCSGVYVLKNQSGADTTAAELAYTFSEETVTDIPAQFFDLKYTSALDSSVQYVLVYANDHDMYELSGFSNPHTTWNQWQGESNVSDFAANPTTSIATNPHTKYHFTKSELP